jgi:hypothetical protein
MAKEKMSKTNVAARAQAKSSVALCRFCGQKVETVLRIPSVGKKHFARVCCERTKSAP